MDRPPKTLPRRSALLLLVLCRPAGAVTVIHFDGTAGLSGATVADIPFANVGGAGVNYGGGAAADRRGRLLRITDGNPLLAPSAEYTGPAIYGGYETIVYDVGSGNFINATRLVETVDSVSIRAAFANANNHPGGVASGFYMFLTGGGVTFDASSSFSMTTGTQGGGLDVRWLVRDGGTYYVSSTTFASTPGTTTNLLDPNSMTWAVFTPEASVSMNLNQSTASFTTRTFTNITAAGVYFEDDDVTSDVTGIDILQFSVDAVPEPATGMALLAGLALGAGSRRRRGGR